MTTFGKIIRLPLRVFRHLSADRPPRFRSLEHRYRHLCAQHSDIHEHLPTLRALAAECDDVVEFGTWTCKSTTALLLGARGKVVSCDHLIWGDLRAIRREIEQVASLARGKFEFIQADTKAAGIFAACDLLFIDTYHNGEQLRAELSRHGDKARMYLVMHDTMTFGTVGDNGGDGLQAAIDEFLASRPHWKLHAFYPNNNGLTVLKRT